MPGPGPNVDDIAYIDEGSGEDGQLQEGDDLQLSIRETLADYLSNISQVNKYPISPGYKEIAYETKDGKPADIVTGGGTPSDAFTTDPSLDSYSNPFLDALAEDIKVADYLDKGESGDTLLQDVQGEEIGKTGQASSSTEGSTKLEQQVSQVLRSNRFNPTPGSSPFVESGQEPTSPGRLRSTLGEFDSPDATPVTFDQLRKVALSLMLKSTGDDPNGSTDPEDAGLGPLAPTLVQIATSRITGKELNAREAFQVKDLPRTDLESDLPYKQDDDFKSYGNLNSFLEPFDGFLPLGMIALSAAMVPTLLVGTELLFSILALIINSDGKSIRLDPGPYIPGQYGKPEADGLLATLISPRALGLVHTEHDFADAAKRGANVFFGFDGDNLASAASDALLNILTSPGYYAVVTRSIFRSANTIANALKDIDFSNPISGAQGVLGMVDVIKSSKIIGFFNVIAGLGDSVLTLEEKGYIIKSGEKIILSDVDRLADTPATHVMKSRAKDGPTSVSLAWRTGATLSSYILPANVVGARYDFGSTTDATSNAAIEALHASSLSGKVQFQRDPNVNRLSADVVKEVENQLECEYVPFYFHDLRTNEIVSFHAFLSELRENYSANYESTDAYGRVDAIKTYKNTTRTLDLTFIAASTSKVDFDELWWKINKLTTLLYPQWDRGSLRTITAGSDQFIQPFSQIPTSSPVIRLRVGDVIKGNYSRFALGRLFGMGTDDFIVDGASTLRDTMLGFFSDDVLATIKSSVERMMLDPDVNEDEDLGFKIDEEAVLLPSQVGYYLEAEASGNLLQKAAAIIQSGTARKKVRTPVEYKVKITNKETKQINRGSTPLLSATKTIYTVTFSDPDNAPSGMEDLSLLVTQADLRVDPVFVVNDALGSGVTSQDSSSIADRMTTFADFLDPTNNPVVRSFESTKGRGLAGVITNMSFDWLDDKVVWETAALSRAPKMFKITMSYSPIHDIPPGIDADGFNRAPIYPVGDIVNKFVNDVHDSDVKSLLAECMDTLATVASQTTTKV